MGKNPYVITRRYSVKCTLGTFFNEAIREIVVIVICKQGIDSRGSSRSLSKLSCLACLFRSFHKIFFIVVIFKQYLYTTVPSHNCR